MVCLICYEGMPTQNKIVIAFIGHRDCQPSKEHEITLFDYLSTFGNKQVDFYLGGYGDFDSFAHRCAKEYKKTHRSARLVFVTPHIGKWPDRRREYLQDEYDEILYPPLEGVPYRFAISQRNCYMMDMADVVIAYVAVDFGGAYQALQYAKAHGKAVINLAGK